MALLKRYEENNEEKYSKFAYEIMQTFNSEDLIHIFDLGYVKRFDINGEFVYLWQDAKGNVCYSFDLLEKEYFTTTATKLANALGGHFQCDIEVVNNINDTLSRKNSAAARVVRAIEEAEMFSYNEQQIEPQGTKNIDRGASTYIRYQREQIPLSQLHQEKIVLSRDQYDYINETYSLCLNELRIVYKEQFKPYTKLFFYRQHALIYKNSYIPSEYMTNYIYIPDLKNSFILSYIFAMAKNDSKKAMSIIVWLANSFNLLQKLPYALVLHSKDNIPIRLFYEEIIEPLFNKNYCETISNDTLDKKALSQQLDEKVIYRFHNITTPTILEENAKELVKRLIHKKEYRLNNKHITTLANTLITSTIRYIPLIAKDVPCIVVDIESNLEEFCKEKHIGTDYYEIAKLIENDLENFAAILRSIELSDLSSAVKLQYYNSDKNSDIIDGDVPLVEVFESALKNKEEAFFQTIKLEKPELYNKLSEDFIKNRIDKKSLLDYFSTLFGEGIFKSNRALIAKLKEISTTKEAFENKDTFNNNGRVYYKIY